MKSKISTFIKLLVIIGFFVWLGDFSQKKINAKILEDIQVVNHNTIYQEKGYPVYTKELKKSEVAYFITDITLNGLNNTGKSYKALVSQDKINSIEVGNKIYVPKNEDALRTGFSWQDSSKYTIGKVVSLSQVPDWQTGFYQVNIELDDELPKQPFYSAKIVNSVKENIVVVPIANLDNIEGSYYAWLADDTSKAFQSLITTGICDGYNCEIISGLKAGDSIITSDRKLLTEGMLLNNKGENK